MLARKGCNSPLWVELVAHIDSIEADVVVFGVQEVS